MSRAINLFAAAPTFEWRFTTMKTDKPINTHLATAQQVLTITYRLIQIGTVLSMLPNMHVPEFVTHILPLLLRLYVI